MMDAKTVKNRLRPDLNTSDPDAAVEQALALGATEADDVYVGPGGGFSATPKESSSASSNPRCPMAER